MMLQSGAHLGLTDFEEAKRCAKATEGSQSRILGILRELWSLRVQELGSLGREDLRGF